ncbi:uncharacterized protein SOCEGT47_074220 [Sorangium cellulosum]|uniref:Cupin type-2 domain-containing protein n=1 Tax=Sorangium cellulosum TaxID=56 RepID=A0A4V0NEP1_SORCE|nr:cupin domain-containing protein [Sorangium cellulosum]AUX26852.1 uncharacterized protein SOCEGT47_074220 [Sorangium cellulosum]
MVDVRWSRKLVFAGMMAAGLSACAHGGKAAPQGAFTRGEPSGRAYHANILQLARSNTAYRRVLYTKDRMQIVVMSIPPGGDVGEERHERVEQILFCAGGSGRVVMGGEAAPFNQGDVVFVPPGTVHNFVNAGATPLKILTIYSPPNHIPGRVQMTKADAEADTEDEEFGRRMERATPAPGARGQRR